MKNSIRDMYVYANGDSQLNSRMDIIYKNESSIILLLRLFDETFAL